MMIPIISALVNNSYTNSVQTYTTVLDKHNKASNNTVDFKRTIIIVSKLIKKFDSVL